MLVSVNHLKQQQGDTVVVASAKQADANAIKTMLSLRNEPVQALPHGELTDLQTLPLLLILDLRGASATFLDDHFGHQKLQNTPTIILSEHYDEEQFLTARDNRALDYLVAPFPPVFLLAKVMDALKEIQEKYQMERYRKLLQQLGAIRERSGVFSTAQSLNRLDDAISDYCADPDSPYSLLIISWAGMPSPCPKVLEAGIYQAIAKRIRTVARANDWVGEYLEEKFLVVLPNTDASGAQVFAARLAEKLKAPIHVMKHGDISLKFSMNTAEYKQGQHYEAWLKQAL